MNIIRYISRPVWLLSLVSLFSDITSEMLYPIMPLYLQSIGFSIIWIGVLEGIAEAIAGLSQGFLVEHRIWQDHACLLFAWGMH